MQPAAKHMRSPIVHHPRMRVGPAVNVYVWPYPLRLAHWGFVLSIGILAVTGYYIHDPFIVGQTKTPFLMGWFRFVHEAAAMAFIACFVIRFYLFFAGDRWVRLRTMLPLQKKQWAEMVQMIRFYFLIRPTPISKVGHNAIAAVSYLAIYALMLVEIISGLVMFNWLLHSSVLKPLVGWIPGLVNIQNIRLIHFCLMFVFIAFGIIHVHMCLIVSSAEKRGLMDSIFTGYKTIPVQELEDDDHEAIAAGHGKRVRN
jgi:Ni/Fe-hydrogenase 1 B-type cytochrome subunit